MADTSPHTVELHRWIDRIRNGDLSAREELIRATCDRLERLARKMIRRFPRVQRWVETDDLLQAALLRLLRALEQVRPDSMRQFFGLAAQQMRRELLNLAQHFYGPRGHGAHQAGGFHRHGMGAPAFDPADGREDPDDMDRWFNFHREVEKLPPEEREVVGLVFYHGWTQAEVAELFQVNERTVRRWWQAAMVKLNQVLGPEHA